jgi:tetratricopeptide (TPR) repeat protein
MFCGWASMPENLLDSWKDVARYLGHSIRTCQRLEQEAGLPIHRMDDSPKARIYAYAAEIDRWREKTAHGRPRTWWRRPVVWGVAGASVLAAAVFLANRAGLIPRHPAAPADPAVSRADDAGRKGSESGEPFLEEARAAQRAYVSECDPGDLERAIDLYKQALAARPGSAAAHFGLGSCYQNDYLFRGAKAASFEAMNTAYAEALRLAPDLPEAQVGMGWSRLLSGQRDQAYVFFHKALDIAPSDPTVNYQIGCFLGHIGLVDKAVFYLTRAIDLGERSIRAYRMRAFYESMAGQYRAAAADTAKLCEMNPTNGKMFCARARSLVMLKDFAGAARELDVAAVLAPADPGLPFTRAVLAAARGEKDRALGMVLTLRERPGSPAADLVPVYALLGLGDETIGEIRAVIDEDMTSFHRAAFAYPSLGDRGNFLFDKVRGLPAFQKIVEELKTQQDDLLRRYRGL